MSNYIGLVLCTDGAVDGVTFVELQPNIPGRLYCGDVMLRETGTEEAPA